LLTAIIAQLLAAVLIGVGLWAYPYYEVWSLVSAWRGRKFCPIGLQAEPQSGCIGGTYTIDPKWQTQVKAMRELQPDKALWALRRALTDEDAEFRRFAVVALGEFGPDAASALPELERLTRNPALCLDVIYTLGRIGPESIAILEAIRARGSHAVFEVPYVETAGGRCGRIATIVIENSRFSEAAEDALCKIYDINRGPPYEVSTVDALYDAMSFEQLCATLLGE
jgi:hypothetical protein